MSIYCRFCQNSFSRAGYSQHFSHNHSCQAALNGHSTISTQATTQSRVIQDDLDNLDNEEFLANVEHAIQTTSCTALRAERAIYGSSITSREKTAERKRQIHHSTTATAQANIHKAEAEAQEEEEEAEKQHQESSTLQNEDLDRDAIQVVASEKNPLKQIYQQPAPQEEKPEDDLSSSGGGGAPSGDWPDEDDDQEEESQEYNPDTSMFEQFQFYTEDSRLNKICLDSEEVASIKLLHILKEKKPQLIHMMQSTSGELSVCWAKIQRNKKRLVLGGSLS
jgi:hypothetical protein